MAEDVYQHDISEEDAPGGRSERRGRSRPEGRKFVRKPKMCAFCVEKGARIDYKQVDVLRRYVTERGKIRPRRQTGMCARHQRRMAMAIKRARHLALLPFTATVSR